MTDSPLNRLAKLHGLGEAYYDHRGELRYFTGTARRAILHAMGIDPDDAALAAELEREAAGAAPPSAPTAASNTCFQLDSLQARGAWGISIQLYTLRSVRNWGVGDFGDLCELIELAAPLGCDVIGLNPLHALFPAEAGHSSPYSPSNRQFLNFLYIAVDAVPEFRYCAEVQSLCNESSFRNALRALRQLDNVAYEQVATLKLTALRLLHAHFREQHLAVRSGRAMQFAGFVDDGGIPLCDHACFDTLDAHFRERGHIGWENWPADYRDPRSAAVAQFAERHAEQIEFFLFAQWLATEQLNHAQSLARSKGMRIGLYGDLAVGANRGGSEVWSNQSLYVEQVSVGAPPDPLALGGQDWGIPPMDPWALRRQRFQPFVDLLRANMRFAGALRIDHVMSMFRLWWVPRGFSAAEGVYVHYPLSELMNIVVDASRRSSCLVIGEDLGTVPDEMRSAMAQHLLYHYKVLLFEKNASGDFHSPQQYPFHAVATATTHDLPPLKAWWQLDDIELRERLGLYPQATTAAQLRAERELDRRALLQALTNAGLWYWHDHQPLPEYSLALSRAVHLYLATSRSAIVLVQLEDLCGMTDPVNVPGTHTEHANWQRKLGLTTAEILGLTDVQEMLRALSKARAGENPNA